jgi:transposase
MMYPFSLSIKGAENHFGLSAGTLYNWISNGTLSRGRHYLKAGRKVLIIRQAMIEFLREKDGVISYGS